MAANTAVITSTVAAATSDPVMAGVLSASGGREGGVTVKRGELGGGVAPVAAGRRDDLPVAAAPLDLNPGRGSYGGAVVAWAGADDVEGGALRGVGLPAEALLGHIGAAQRLAVADSSYRLALPVGVFAGGH